MKFDGLYVGTKPDDDGKVLSLLKKQPQFYSAGMKNFILKKKGPTVYLRSYRWPKKSCNGNFGVYGFSHGCR